MSADPELTRIYRWRDATPRLELGHLRLMERIGRRLDAMPLSASGFRGTGIADCIADARLQASRTAGFSAARSTSSIYSFVRASAMSDRTRSAAG